MTCSHSGCGNEATVHCVWGLYAPCEKSREEPMNEADLCGDCSDALWQTVKGAVNAGHMHWVNRAVESRMVALEN